MAKPIITIIGLNLIGASMGLALQREPGNFEIVGHDRDPEATQLARQRGAVTRTEWNLHNACAGSDMIILAAPPSELDDLLPHIREDLKPETLLFAAVDVMQPTLQRAAERLPGGTHFVVGHPILTGIGGPLIPRADLFDEITFCVATGVETLPAAMQLASDLVERVGAKPLFVDALEHDGLIAGVEQLPQVLAAALIGQNIASQGWREGKRLAGRAFAHASEIGESGAALYDGWLGNRTNLLARVAALQAELADWQRLLAAADEPAGAERLKARLEEVVVERLRWEGQVMLKQWDDSPKVEAPAQRGMFQQMLFGGLMGRGKRSGSS